MRLSARTPLEKDEGGVRIPTRQTEEPAGQMEKCAEGFEQQGNQSKYDKANPKL